MTNTLTILVTTLMEIAGVIFFLTDTHRASFTKVNRPMALFNNEDRKGNDETLQD